MSNPNFLTANTSGIELMPGVNDTAVGYDINRVIQALNGINLIPITTGDLTVTGNETISGTLQVTGAVTFSSLVGPLTINPPPLVIGATSPQSNAMLSVRNQGNDIEFGHQNTAGYGSTIGAEVNSGKSFIAFSAEAGTNVNTYKTRGLKGAVIRSDLAGGLVFSTIPNTNADNQSPTDLAALSTLGVLTVAGGVGITAGGISVTGGTTTDSLTVSGTAALNGTTTVGASGKIQSSSVGWSFSGDGTSTKRFRASAWCSTGTSITAAGVVIPYDTKLYDPNTNFDVTTNKGRYTCPVAGVYFVCGAFRVTSQAEMILDVMKTGSWYRRLFLSGTAGAFLASGGTFVDCAANDYIELKGFMPNGAQSLAGTASSENWISIEYMGASA